MEAWDNCCDDGLVHSGQINMNGDRDVVRRDGATGEEFFVVWKYWVWLLCNHILNLVSLLNLICWYQRFVKMCAIGNWVVYGAALDGGAWAACSELDVQDNDLTNTNGTYVDPEVGDGASSGSTEEDDEHFSKIQGDRSPEKHD